MTPIERFAICFAEIVGDEFNHAAYARDLQEALDRAGLVLVVSGGPVAHG